MKANEPWLDLFWYSLSRKFRHIWHNRDIRGGVIWWLGVSLLACLLSIMAIASNEDSTKNIQNDKFSLGQILIAFAAGIIIQTLVWLVFRKRWPKKKLGNGEFDIITNVQTKSDVGTGFILATLTLFVALTLTILGKHYPFNFGTGLSMFLENPGGLFAFITGGGTLIGTYVAIKSILEMKNTITSYPQLLDRLTHLINTAPNSKDGIRILSYFILPGNWQVRSKTIKTNFKDSLKQENKLFKIVCLKLEDHMSMLIDIAKKGTKIMREIDAEKILQFQIECEDLLDSFNSNNRESEFQSAPIRLSWKDMPSYYFFVTDNRAIIVTPVGLPQINKKIETGKVEEMKKIINQDGFKTNKTEKNKILKMINVQLHRLDDIPDKKDPAEVDTLGFETTDRHIIEKLQLQFDLIIKSAP